MKKIIIYSICFFIFTAMSSFLKLHANGFSETYRGLPVEYYYASENNLSDNRKEIKKEADLIVKVKIESVERYIYDEKFPKTKYRVKVKKVFKGNCYENKNIYIIYKGGISRDMSKYITSGNSIIPEINKEYTFYLKENNVKMYEVIGID